MPASGYMKILIPPTCFAQSTVTGIARSLPLPRSCPQHPTLPTQTALLQANQAYRAIVQTTHERFREVKLLPKATQLYTELALQTLSPKDTLAKQLGGC